MNSICPYLGLLDDPDTRVIYPAAANCCHRAEPAGSVTLEHQSMHCLNSHHRTCAVFLRGAGKPLPETISVKQPTAGWKQVGVLGMLFAALVLGAILLWQLANTSRTFSARGATGQQGTPYPTSTYAAQLFWQALAATRVAELRESVYLPGVFANQDGQKVVSAPPSTDTPQPTITEVFAALTEAVIALQPTATAPLPQPEPTQCQPRTSWPIYTVQGGDTLYKIAREVGATAAQLIAANCLRNDIIRPGQPLHVPVIPKPTQKPTKAPQATATVAPPPPPTNTVAPPPTAIPPPPTATTSP